MAPAVVPAERRPSRALPGLVALVGSFVVALMSLLIFDPVATSDEPHYALLAESLVEDGDVDLRDDYGDAGSLERWTDGRALDRHGYDYRDDSRWRSVHGLGLPLLLAPLVAVGADLTVLRLALVVVSALLGWQLLGLLGDLVPDAGRWRWAVLASVVLALPILSMAGQVFPDLPGALGVVLGLRAVVSPSGRRLWVGVAAVAWLPWLHVRYGLLAAALVGALAWVLVRPDRLGPGFGELQRRRVTPLVVPVVAWGVLGLCFWRWYGSPLPDAPYRNVVDPGFNQAVPRWSTSTIHRFGLGALLSPSFGLVPFAPVLLLAVAGVVPVARRWRWGGVIAVGVVLAYLMSLSGLDPSRNLQGRFAVPIVGVLAVALLVVTTDVRWGRGLLLGLGAVGLVISLGALRGPFSRLNASATGRTTVPVARSLAGSWPDMTNSEVPLAVLGPPSGAPEEGVVAATDGVLLRPGLYEAEVALGRPGRMRVRAVAGDGRVLVDEAVLAAEPVPGVARPSSARVPFTVPSGADETTVALSVVSVDDDVAPVTGRIDVAPRHQASFPDWPKALAWTVGPLAVGTYLSRRGPRGDRPRSVPAWSRRRSTEAPARRPPAPAGRWPGSTRPPSRDRTTHPVDPRARTR